MKWPFAREAKANPVGAALFLGGGDTWASWVDRRKYIREGYQQNPVVYRAVDEVARAVASLELEIETGRDVTDTHPALELLARPNPMQGGDQFIFAAMIDLMLLGEVAIVKPVGQVKPAELWLVSPLDITVEPGRGGLPNAYEHKQGGVTTRFQVNPLDGRSDLFFFKRYNPDNYWRGQSPLMASALWADIHNVAGRWNYSLLKNSARPSGLVTFEGMPGGDVLNRLREWFKRSIQGEANAGEVPMLTDGAKWERMSDNAKDMDFHATLKEAAKLVASSLGVPLPLIDNDASTFNNLEQAKERLYTDTVLPIANEFFNAFGSWLLPGYGAGLRLEVNMDAIPALEGARTRKFDRTIKAFSAGLLTVEEGRDEIGYGPLGADDVPGIKPEDAKALAYGSAK